MAPSQLEAGDGGCEEPLAHCPLPPAASAASLLTAVCIAAPPSPACAGGGSLCARCTAVPPLAPAPAKLGTEASGACGCGGGA